VNPSSAPAGVELLLGRDHEEYGAFNLVSISANTAATISPGSDVDYLRASKAKYDVNEDAALVFEDARHTVMCVADAHYGRNASDALISTLADALSPVPQNPAELDNVLRDLAEARTKDRYASETTLLVCIHDRLFRQTFGVSFGDSSLVHIDADGNATLVSEKTPTFVSPTDPQSLRPSRAKHFALSPKPGDLLIAYTDGIDECCYRDPDRSITLDILGQTVTSCDADVQAIARAITELALAGVGDQPGGQDNLALVVTRA
jgi:hypothetical protein